MPFLCLAYLENWNTVIFVVNLTQTEEMRTKCIADIMNQSPCFEIRKLTEACRVCLSEWWLMKFPPLAFFPHFILGLFAPSVLIKRLLKSTLEWVVNPPTNQASVRVGGFPSMSCRVLRYPRRREFLMVTYLWCCLTSVLKYSVLIGVYTIYCHVY